MNAEQAAVLDDIRAEFEEAIDVTPVAGGGPQTIAAVFSSRAGEDFLGPGHSVRHSWFQIAWDDWPFPADPSRRDVITYAGQNWSVTDVVRREEVAAWDVSVERTA